MATEHCIDKNPKLQNIGNPFQALFELLPQLQYAKLPNGQPGYVTETDILQAIHDHAEESNEELLRSLPSLGTILATAADNTDMGLSTQDIAQIGWLIQSLGHLLIACNGVKENTRYELLKRGALI